MCCFNWGLWVSHCQPVTNGSNGLPLPLTHPSWHQSVPNAHSQNCWLIEWLCFLLYADCALQWFLWFCCGGQIVFVAWIGDYFFSPDGSDLAFASWCLHPLLCCNNFKFIWLEKPNQCPGGSVDSLTESVCVIASVHVPFSDFPPFLFFALLFKIKPLLVFILCLCLISKITVHLLMICYHAFRIRSCWPLVRINQIFFLTRNLLAAFKTHHCVWTVPSHVQSHNQEVGHCAVLSHLFLGIFFCLVFVFNLHVSLPKLYILLVSCHVVFFSHWLAPDAI